MKTSGLKTRTDNKLKGQFTQIYKKKKHYPAHFHILVLRFSNVFSPSMNLLWLHLSQQQQFLFGNKVQPLLEKLQYPRDQISQGRVIKYDLIWVNQLIINDIEMLLNLKKLTWFLKEHVENKERNEQDAIINSNANLYFFNRFPDWFQINFLVGLKGFFPAPMQLFSYLLSPNTLTGESRWLWPKAQHLF